MDGEVDGGDGSGVGFFPPTRKLLVVNHRFGVEEVEAVVDEPDGEGVMVLLSPGMDMRGVFVQTYSLVTKAIR